MKQWASQVEQLKVCGPECRRSANPILWGEPVLTQEKDHIDQSGGLPV